MTDIAAFVESHGGVVRIDPQSGHRDVVSSNTAPAGAPNFVTPTGIALERCQLVRVVVQLQTETIKVCI